MEYAGLDGGVDFYVLVWKYLSNQKGICKLNFGTKMNSILLHYGDVQIFCVRLEILFWDKFVIKICFFFAESFFVIWIILAANVVKSAVIPVILGVEKVKALMK